MPYNVPTLRQITASGLLDIESSLGTVLPKFGIEQALNAAVSAGQRDLYDHQMWIVRQIIPTSESDDQTIIETAQLEGVIRKQATYAAGPATLQGTVPAPVGTVLQHSDGRQYTVTSSLSPVGSVVSVQIQAVLAGADGNLAAGEVLTLVTPVPGLNPNGVSGELIGGADIESIPQLLERLLFRKRNPPMGGALHDYILWMREVAGVTRAWSYDAWHGRGTVGIAWVYDDRASIVPTYQEQLAMQDYLFRHNDPATGVPVGRPAGIEPVYTGLTTKEVAFGIVPTPDTPDVRTAIVANLEGLQSTLSPGQTLLLSRVRTAIGSAPGLENYTLDLAADVPALASELIIIGDVLWPTL
ncbi:TPA: baseplate J/gp47 family protein [Aeromonas veronii]|uniref:baseplate J/gp47 family protein n=1 Tax=Aeromonas veronii TaxID=654 RepID=UPI00330B3D76|nr:baseplate J/gp47 family protein [Aeromonas veronii]HDO1332170.1 baseplate J/gp47 family protein [Aeromonas veronii]HDO1339087.1 baseplate J/gp47 family protein [Aeromonas veronii]HDO1341230.1 baseplate J/gp47 family protein [Aeromonas veronii]HDO1345804.1 baseplate J/gp47 family protein [Aeromonas veronii]